MSDAKPKPKRAPTALWGLAWAALLFHIVWLGLIVVTVMGTPFAPAITEPSADGGADSIAVAYQLGRLDLVSLSLTVLASVLAIGAFGGFFLVRGAAMQAAIEEAQEVAAKEAGRVAEHEARVVAGPIARRTVLEALSTGEKSGENRSTNYMRDMLDALDQDEGEDPNGR